MALTREFYTQRQTRRSYRYRLERRAREVLGAIREFADGQPKLILDVGTADGLMLEYLSPALDATLVGLDISFELLTANPDRSFQAAQADALAVPFREGIFDVVITTAVIEHVHDEKRFLCECQRVLKKGGLLVLTTPHPFFDRISELIGHTEKGHHVKTLNLSELKSLCLQSGFRILKAERFMMSPIGFPKENDIERVMRAIGLSLLLMNQLVVASKQGGMGMEE